MQQTRSSRASIVIPVLNEAATIAVTLADLQPLREQDCELILVDGGSRDNTAALAEGLVDQLLFSEPGRAVQMNYGARHSAAPWLFFLHGDTTLPANFIQVLTTLNAETSLADQNLTTNKQTMWGFFRLKLSGEDIRFRVIEQFINWRSKLSGIGTGDQVLFMHRECFFGNDGFAPIPLMEDVELCRRLKKIVGRPHVLPDLVVTSSRRWQNNGVVKTVLLMWRLRFAYWRGVNPEKLARQYLRHHA